MWNVLRTVKILHKVDTYTVWVGVGAIGWVGGGGGVGGFIIVNDIRRNTQNILYLPTYIRMYNKIYSEKVRTYMYRVVRL